MLNLDSCFVVAEAGTSHADPDPEIRLERVIECVYAAAKVRVDAIKFQIFNDPNLGTMFCWIDGDDERSYRWRESRLSLDNWKQVKLECDDIGIIFLASVFEYETIKWLNELQVAATKVACRAAPYLDTFKDAPRPLLVSNGMTEVEEVEDIIILLAS